MMETKIEKTGVLPHAISKGFKLTGATSSTKNTCSEFCGDSIRIGSTGCADGNSKDG